MKLEMWWPKCMPFKSAYLLVGPNLALSSEAHSVKNKEKIFSYVIHGYENKLIA